MIEKDATRTVVKRLLAESPTSKHYVVQKRVDDIASKSTPNRFWEHLGFCWTLFWGLRKMKHLRAGQLLCNAINRTPTFLEAQLFSIEDDDFSHLIEDYVMNNDHCHCGTKHD